MQDEIKKFKQTFKELYINTSSGKASGSGFIGLILGFVGAFSFLLSIIGYFFSLPQTVEIQENIIVLITISAALLGVRKWAGVNINKHNNKSQDKNL